MSKSYGRSALVAAAIGVASLAFAVTGTAATPPVPPPPPNAATHAPQARPQSILDQLDLTDAQRTRIRELAEKNVKQERPLMQMLRAKQDAFASLTPGTSGYQAAANALATAEGNAARNRVLNEASFRESVYHLLTPAQRTKVTQLTAERKAKIQKWRQQRMQQAAAAKAAAPSSGK